MNNQTLATSPQKIKSKPAAGVLGNHTKSHHPPLSKFALQSLSRKQLPKERVKSCCRTIMTDAQFVTVNRHSSGGHSFGNVMKCGSVWVCPVCAAKIVGYRRADLAAFIDAAGVKGGAHITLLTLTVPHTFTGSLVDTLGKISKAKTLMQHRKQWQTIAGEIGLLGQIRTLEVTHGKNGWHPHFHILLFTHGVFDVEAIKFRILDAWQKAALSVGLSCPNEHGVDIRATTKGIADYVQKWGVDYEMTCGGTGKQKEHNKHGKTPFQLLAESEESPAAAALFREYAAAFKGKRQLVYSRGLRKRFDFESELTDEEILEQEEQETSVVAVISPLNWQVLCRLPGDVRGLILETLHFHNNITGANESLARQGIGHILQPPPLSLDRAAAA